MLNNINIIDLNKGINHLTYCINQDKPLFFSRFGGSDTNVIKIYFNNKSLIKNKDWYEFNVNIVKMYNGYFDFENSVENFQHYLEKMISYYRLSDDCFFTQCELYFKNNDLQFLNHALDGKTIIDYKFIEYIKPFLNSFSEWGKNKKILIISPLSKSIEHQFKNKDKLYIDYKFPEFELKTYNTKITYNSKEDTKQNLNITTNNWHEECERMANEIKNIDFNIALLSCASYGMFLGNYIKYELKKKAVYFGGVLNVLFNIYGGRYSDNYYTSCGLDLNYQIDPLENTDIINIRGGRGNSTEGLGAYFGKRKNN